MTDHRPIHQASVNPPILNPTGNPQGTAARTSRLLSYDAMFRRTMDQHSEHAVNIGYVGQWESWIMLVMVNIVSFTYEYFFLIDAYFCDE